MIFADRTEAGKKLAQKLIGEALIEKIPALLKSNSDLRGGAIVLALPRGGVPVAAEIAKAIKAPLDLLVAHKLGAPENEEFAIGAVAEDGSVFLDEASVSGISKDYIEAEIKTQLAEIKKRIKKYRGGRPLPDLRGRTVILADDGIATGNTIKAAIALAKNAKAQRIIVAVPVLPSDTLADLQKQAEVVCLDTPFPFLAIGRFYENFSQLTDEEVRGYME